MRRGRHVGSGSPARMPVARCAFRWRPLRRSASVAWRKRFRTARECRVGSPRKGP
jgi:hypothetical protein